MSPLLKAATVSMHACTRAVALYDLVHVHVDEESSEDPLASCARSLNKLGQATRIEALLATTSIVLGVSVAQGRAPKSARLYGFETSPAPLKAAPTTPHGSSDVETIGARAGFPQHLTLSQATGSGRHFTPAFARLGPALRPAETLIFSRGEPALHANHVALRRLCQSESRRGRYTTARSAL